jgi:hypothetical protein
MLYFPNGRASISIELPVAAGSTIAAEGQALISDLTSGVAGVKPSTGASTDNFMGVSISRPMTLNFVTKVEEAVHGTGNTYTLARTPAAGTLSVYNKTDGAVVPASGGGAWSLTGKVVTLDAATQGDLLEYTYRYAPTVTEARAIQGDVWPGGPPGQSINQVGLIKNGIVYTDQFDTTVNWHASNPVVRVAANGLFTVGGSGAIVPCAIVAIPSVSQPFLGLELRN